MNQIFHFKISSVLTKSGSRTSTSAGNRCRHACRSEWALCLAKMRPRKSASNRLALELNAVEIKSLQLMMSKGGLGSAGSGFKNFLRGLALGKLRWNVGPRGRTLAADASRDVSWCLGSGCQATSVPVQLWLLSRSGTSGSGRFQDKSSFTLMPFNADLGFMQVWLSGCCGVLLIWITFHGHFCFIHCG